MRTVLLTGFQPFGGETRNASWEAVRSLDGAIVNGARVVARELPTELVRGPELLLAAVDELGPELVLCVGQARDRLAITVERRFVNRVDAPIPDNAGWHPRGEAIVGDGPPALEPAIDVQAALDAVRAEGIPAEASDDAGRYVCNATAYRLALAMRERTGVAHGFVHVPSLPSSPTGGMDTATVARALRAIVAALVR